MALPVAVFFACAACVSTASGPDIGPFDGALPEMCLQGGGLAVGQCVVAGSTSVCAGTQGESSDIIVLQDGDRAPMVVGPQAAVMFVLSLRADGIDPGPPDPGFHVDHPLVDIRMQNADGELVARYRGRPAFASGGTPGSVRASGLFVVVDGRWDLLIDRRVTTSVLVTDRAGVQRCARREIVATYQR